MCSRVKAILHKEGFQTIEAGDGIEAFNLVQEFGKDIALLLTDIKMPGMDGVSLAESVRELYPRMPVLFISAYIDPDPRDRLIEGYSLLAKPFRPQTLIKAVRELLTTVIAARAFKERAVATQRSISADSFSVGLGQLRIPVEVGH